MASRIEELFIAMKTEFVAMKALGRRRCHRDKGRVRRDEVGEKLNSGGDEMENHEDITLRSGGEVEELNEIKEVEEGDEKLVEHVKNEDESTSLKHEETNEEVEMILEMTPWAYV